MRRTWLAITCLALLAGPAAAEPFRFVHRITIADRQLSVPVDLFLTARSAQRIGFRVGGNLTALQDNLPGLLSTVIEDTCTRRIAFQFVEARAEGDAVAFSGRAEVARFACRDAQAGQRGVRLASTVIDVSGRLVGRIEDDCLDAEVRDLSIAPRGLVGAVIDMNRLTPRLEAAVTDEINDTLADRSQCNDLPDTLQLLDATNESGGFRDFGDGTMGFVMEGRLEVTAQKMIDLIGLLSARGALRR